ncbi:MAG: DUF2920 family protein [Pirellulales bacterium]
MLRRRNDALGIICLLLAGWAASGGAVAAADPTDGLATWPALPERDGSVELPAQQWPLRPGPRRIRVLVHYPGGRVENVGSSTGVMLTLHNWGGVDCVGTASPRTLADRLNVVALCVNYLQSGKQDSIDGPEPYDFGYLQSLDALRALAWTCDRLRQRGQFADGRLFCTGGSGGGNVTLMAQKLAPRTFACVVDLCGMKKLSDDIAYNLPGGSELNARYRRESDHPYLLALDEQELRFLGNREHLAVQKKLNSSTRIITVHGRLDATCPFPDAVEMVEAMRAERLAVEPHFVATGDLDGKVFTSAGHPLGNRTEIVFAVAGKYLADGGVDSLVRQGPHDFARRETINYPTTNGTWIIDYSAGYPVGRFEARPALPVYPSRTTLLEWRDSQGRSHSVEDAAQWRRRRDHIVQSFELAAGTRPSPLARVPLDAKWGAPIRDGRIVRYPVSYQSDHDDRTPAWLLLPEAIADQWERQKLADKLQPATPVAILPVPAVLCLHQTTAHGKDEPAGVAGDASLAYARELTERGFVTLAPDYPSLGAHAYDFAPSHGYASGTMKAIWDNSRAVDLLETLPFVDSQRLGVVGHSLGGHSAVFTALFDERLRVIVSSCGFSSFEKDDVPSWNGVRYMPRIATQFANDRNRLPFDFPELIAALAPRPFLAVAATRDADFDVEGVRDCLRAAKSVYALHRAENALQALYPDAPHSFPVEARRRAYEFIEVHFGMPQEKRQVSNLKSDEQVVLFPAAANWNRETRRWEAPLRAWVYESRSGSLRERALLELLTASMELKEEQEKEVLRERLAPFVADSESGKRIVVQIGGSQFALAESGLDGHAVGAIELPQELGIFEGSPRAVRMTVALATGDERTMEGRILCIPEEGWSVVSDIDDTIKESQVLDRKELLRNTFLRPFRPVSGMADRYREWNESGDVAWHFVSGSPWQLYGPLHELTRSAAFPDGAFQLRSFHVLDPDALKQMGDSQAFKSSAISQLMQRFPRRRFVLVGDTGEKDPEVYGELARRFPTQVAAIYLRNVTDESPESPRWDAAMQGVPTDRWRLFDDASQLPRSLSKQHEEGGR